MARDGAVYVCQSCGAVQSKWAGQCPACEAWNTLVEEMQSRPPGALAPARSSKARGLAFEGLEGASPAPSRIVTGVEEFDRVCGGGVARGSAVLVGGDPGVGKSTLLLQVVRRGGAARARPAPTSPARRRSSRSAPARRAWAWRTRGVKLAAETAVRDIVDGLKRERFDLVVVDSIQTLWSDMHEAGPGSVTQVRAAP